jgi:hypothetical protein
VAGRHTGAPVGWDVRQLKSVSDDEALPVAASKRARDDEALPVAASKRARDEVFVVTDLAGTVLRMRIKRVMHFGDGMAYHRLHGHSIPQTLSNRCFR